MYLYDKGILMVRQIIKTGKISDSIKKYIGDLPSNAIYFPFSHISEYSSDDLKRMLDRNLKLVIYEYNYDSNLIPIWKDIENNVAGKFVNMLDNALVDIKLEEIRSRSKINKELIENTLIRITMTKE
jgi:hypothetical protein